jgi:GTPase SAR1 family protein
MKILIFGLPGSGKTYLATELVKILGDQVAWFNADQVRSDANDWDFSEEGRLRQKQRMYNLCKEAEDNGKIAIADFVCPFDKAREEFGADYTVWVDTIAKGRFEDTNAVFERPNVGDCNYVVKSQRGDIDAKLIAWEIGDKFIWNNKAPSTQMLGRWQPWHLGHQALFDRALAKHGQVFLMVRDMPTDGKNPFPATVVVENLKEQLVKFAGQVKISIVPNILNITYGRDVGYKIEQEVFDDATHDISATKIREQMRKEGKL